MKIFFKENWFKGGILLLVFIATCSIVYYYLVLRPQQDGAILQRKISAQNEAEEQQMVQQQQQVQTAAEKEQQFKNCIDNAHQVFLSAGLAECQSLGYTQDQINNLQCHLPDNQVLVKQQSDAEALCATLYK